MNYPSSSLDPLSIIAEFYAVGNAAHKLLVEHSFDVAQLALEIARQKPQLNIDQGFVFEAAMLHDIGIFLTDCPDIYCYGREPYVKHGILGAEILRNHHLPFHALVAERHTSSGLTLSEIVAEKLPLPLDRSYMPSSIEEKVICYADCFFSKTHPHEKKTPEQVVKKMMALWKRYNLQGAPCNALRFEELHQLFHL